MKVGIDSVEVERIEKLVCKNERFIERVFSCEEQSEFKNRSSKPEHIAAAYAAKDLKASHLQPPVPKRYRQGAPLPVCAAWTVLCALHGQGDGRGIPRAYGGRACLTRLSHALRFPLALFRARHLLSDEFTYASRLSGTDRIRGQSGTPLY